jgi:hypothetical protein
MLFEVIGRKCLGVRNLYNKYFDIEIGLVVRCPFSGQTALVYTCAIWWQDLLEKGGKGG